MINVAFLRGGSGRKPALGMLVILWFGNIVNYLNDVPSFFSNVIPDDQKTETEGVEDEKSTTPDQSAPIEKPTPTGKGKGMTGEILFVLDFYLAFVLKAWWTINISR